MAELTALASDFSLLAFYNTVKPMMLFVLGMLIYVVFIFKFYRFIARKDIFKLGLADYNVSEAGFFRILFGGLLYTLEYLILFPIITFFWFITLSILLIFLSKNQEIQQVLLIAMALIAVIRATAYYNEDLSKDLAKMLPFALLGIFIIDISYFSFSSSIEVMKALPSMVGLIFYYLLAVILLEFMLRVLYFIAKIITGGKEEVPEEE